jgi:hypothetical protein
MKARSNAVAITVLYKSRNSTIIYRKLIKHTIVSLLLGHKEKEISGAQDLHFFGTQSSDDMKCQFIF